MLAACSQTPYVIHNSTEVPCNMSPAGFPGEPATEDDDTAGGIHLREEQRKRTYATLESFGPSANAPATAADAAAEAAATGASPSCSGAAWRTLG